MVRKPRVNRAVTCSLALILLAAAPAFCDDKAPSTVTQLEQRLFFKTYSRDDLPTRLSRIEREVFGEPVNADEKTRLSRLQTVLQQRIDAEHAQEATAKPVAPPPAESAATTPTVPVKEDPAAALERQRLAARAAREAEINKLLADGVDLYRSKHGLEAQQKFVQILRLDPANAQAHFNLGIVKESMGNYVEALSNYEVAAQEDPSNKDYSDAVAAVKEQAMHQRQTVDQQSEMKKIAANANAAWKRGDYLSALDLYLQLDTREPNKALVKYNIGSIYLMMKDHLNALEYYKQAHKLEPGTAKYTTAYQELLATVNKERQEREAVQRQTAQEYQQAGMPVKTPAQRVPARKPTQMPMQTMPAQMPMQTMPAQMPMQTMPAQMPMQTMPAQMPMQTMPAQMPMQTMPAQMPMQTMPVQQMPGQVPQTVPMQAPTMQPVRQVVQSGGYPAPFSPFAQIIQPGKPKKQKITTRPSYGLTPAAAQSLGLQGTAPGAIPIRGASMSTFGVSGKTGDQGIIVTRVAAGSRAAAAGLQKGDEICAVDGNQVTNPTEADQALANASGQLKIKVMIMRGGNLAVLEF